MYQSIAASHDETELQRYYQNFGRLNTSHLYFSGSEKGRFGMEINTLSHLFFVFSMIFSLTFISHSVSSVVPPQDQGDHHVCSVQHTQEEVL